VRHCDVAVIGGGPAGSVAALVLANAALNVVLLHSSENAEADVAFAETLSPAAAPVLARLRLLENGTLDEMPRIPSFVSRWGSPHLVSRPAFVVPDAPTFSIDRRKLDSALRNSAEARGAKIVFGRVCSVTRGFRLWHVQCRDGESVGARFIIDASGRGAHFARRAGARLVAVDKLVASMRVYEATPEDDDRSVVIESTPNGWWFTTLDASGNRVVSFFTDGDLLGSARSVHGFDSVPVISHALGSRRRRRYSERICSAATLALDRVSVPGMLAIGDAAQTSDPLSSLGIAAALEDAESAAARLAADFESHAEQCLEEHEYHRRVRLAGYLRERCSYYSTEDRWSDRPFWRRRQDRAEIEFSIRSLSASESSRGHLR